MMDYKIIRASHPTDSHKCKSPTTLFPFQGGVILRGKGLLTTQKLFSQNNNMAEIGRCDLQRWQGRLELLGFFSCVRFSRNSFMVKGMKKRLASAKP